MKKNVKCYGKNIKPPKREKSFIRNFFEGNESSSSSLFGKSSEDVLEKDSLEENKENKESLFSPTLFQNISVKSISPEKEIWSERRAEKTNKKVKRKRVIKRKPKQVFPYSTKHYVSLQPNWNEIYRHDLTIEKERDRKRPSMFSSRYGNYNKIRHTRPHTSVKNNREKRKIPKKMQRIFSSSENSLDSSSDYIITKVSGCRDVTLESVNACDPKDLNASSVNIFPELSRQYVLSEFQNVSSPENNLNNAFPSGANIIPELSKKFEESCKIGDNMSPISYTKFKEIHELKSHGSENLTNLNLVSKLRSDDISVKTISSKSNSFICASYDPTPSVLKLMTSTPIIPKTTSIVRHPVNVDSSYDQSCGSGASSKKASYGIPYSMIIKEKSLNFHYKKSDCSGELYPKSTPNKERMSGSLGVKSLSSNLVCCNKSVTLPNKKSMKTVSSVTKNRSLLVSQENSSPKVEETHESMKIKLLNLCNQDSVAAFGDVYDWKKFKIKKIGEGSFAEVYMITLSRKSCVLKVIPVSENDDDDCEGLSNVLSEVQITKCLSQLGNNKRNNAKSFIKMNRVFVVTGIYPKELIAAWDHFSQVKTSYNARPDNYKGNKMFVLLELDYGGTDMSSCVLRNALEAQCVLNQVATALAVAEEEFLFEHRDLHLGNILIKRTKKKNMTYKLRGKDISFECHGVEATLIDFTLSRLYEEGYIYYNDLANDISLFEQSGDVQFQVYKDMKNYLGNKWQECCFYSNILWLKYLCQKFKEFEYSRPSTTAHKKGLKAIDKFNNQLTNCNSAVECLTICGITPICFERSNTDSELTKKSILISRNSIQKSKLSLY